MSRRGAVVLAGGRSERLGGVCKPLIRLGDVSILRRTIQALEDAGCERIDIVGPVLDSGLAVRWVEERPPFAGPAAALVTALSAPSGDDEWTFVLAADLAHAECVVSTLSRAADGLPTDVHGACLDDGSGRQWLAGIHRTDALRSAALALRDGGRDASIRVLLRPLRIVSWRAASDVIRDIDTPEDLALAQRAWEGM